MKKTKILLAAVLLLAVVSLLSSCFNTQYTVTFNSQEGSFVQSQKVDAGGKTAQPTSPYRDGYAFGGWYKESACTNKWIFETDRIAGDVTLYAKWTSLEPTYNTYKFWNILLIHPTI